MEKKLLKKLLAILAIMVLVSSDFFVLGSNLISYAAELDSSTNNPNIEFSTYFKNEAGERIDNIAESIKKDGIKMYAEIKVKNEGYFNGAIELVDSNFKIKNNILSSAITSIEGNKVNLNQINAGSTVEVEMEIEPMISDTMPSDMLTKASTVKLTGTYMKAEYKLLSNVAEDTNIEATKAITATFQEDAETTAELETQIITNKVFSVNGTDKRIVQILVKSRLTDNAYPIKQTTLNINVPELSGEAPEDVKVLSLGTKATNGESDKTITDFTNSDGKVQIVLSNEPNENNEITWLKNVYDEVVVTFIYDKDVDVTELEAYAESEILIYNSENKYTAWYKHGIKNQELNGIITTELENNTTDLYKGQLYANKTSEEKEEIEYKTNTILKITNVDIANQVTVHEGADVFTTDSSELTANTKYVKTEINKEKMLAILGESGNIQIKNGDTTQNITKDTEANESGNIVINYENGINELEIAISKPVNAGILEIQHTKAITDNSTYTITQLKAIKALKIKDTVIGTLGENKVVENSTETSLELKETITKAELTVNKENLSTLTKNTDVKLGVELITDGSQYDLYKRPNIKIQLPESVEKVENSIANKVYAEGFEVSAKYDETSKIIEIQLTGEQTSYPKTEATQLYLQLNLDITLDKYAPSKTDKIVMTYTNENATQYEGGRTDYGVVEKEVGIISPSGMVTANNVETYNIEGIVGINDNKQLAGIDKNTAGGTDVTFGVALINNTKAVANNVMILGKLPTDGEFTYGSETITNNLATTLKGSIKAENATIYYSSNMNATEDLNDANNGWTQTPMSNVKSYLIVITSMEAETNYKATYTVTLPQELNSDMTSYTGYKVIYNGNETAESILVGLTTGQSVHLEANISATVGTDTLNNGDTVKSGEVIRYKVTAKNNGTQALTNVILKAGVPEGTVVVVPEEDYVYTGASYYEEKTGITEMSQTIERLDVGQEYTMEYDVRVNMDTADGTNISNKSIVTYGQDVVESNELNNTISKGNLRVTIKRVIDEVSVLQPGAVMEYQMFIENLSDEPIKNLKMKMPFENQTIKGIYVNGATSTNIPEVYEIEEIAANSVMNFDIATKITSENAGEITATIILTDEDGNVYRSNKDIQPLETIGVEVTLTSPTDGQYVNIGEQIVYDITVKNTGSFATQMHLTDSISEYLTIEAVYVNGELKTQTTNIDESNYLPKVSNEFIKLIMLDAGKIENIKLVTRVNNIEEEFDVKTITNSVVVSASGDISATSSEVYHIIRKDNSQDLKNTISGIAWLDANQDGQMDEGDTKLPNINVKLFDVSTNNIAKDKDGNIAETKTDSNGYYTFTKIVDGQYIVVFEYDTSNYELTTYMKEGVSESKNSNAILKTITINGEEKVCAVTDIINLTDNTYNINLGLKENLTFDLELNKYINRISVQNSKGTKSYDYSGKDSTFQKVEINRKQINGSVVVLEYTIRVKNTGKLAGYATNIKDYLPSDLEFSSELNPDWYLSGTDLYTKSLSNTKLEPGETKDIKLILTKTMTDENTGVINNRAEIIETYNEYGKSDIDSIVNNQASGEDDLGSADVLIGPSTGGRKVAFSLLIMINAGLIAIAIKLIFKRSKGVK